MPGSSLSPLATSPSPPRSSSWIATPGTPPPRASTSSSSRGGHRPASVASYRLLIPTVSPKDVDLPHPLANFDIVDEVELKGYKVFAVQDWLCERELMPLFMEWTGNDEHMIKAYVIQPIPYAHTADAEEAQERALAFLSHNGIARVRETAHGKIMAVTASSFPQDVAPLQILSGDFRGSRDLFYAAIDLARMRQLGRAQFDPYSINDAIRSSFVRRYVLPDSASADLFPSVILLVQLVQSALAHFGFFDLPIDGLLCNHTLDSLLDFETLIADGRAPVEIKDLESEMVARLLSTVWGAKAKLVDLGWYDRSAKDPFYEMGDFEAALRNFQKAHSMLPTSPFLSLEILNRLHAAHQTFNNARSDTGKKIKDTVRRKLSITTNFFTHHNSPPHHHHQSDAEHSGAVECSTMEDFARNVKIFGKRDRMDSLRLLWLGEGTKPEKVWAEARFGGDAWGEDGRKRGRVGRMVGRVREGIGMGRKTTGDGSASDLEPHFNADSIPIVMVSEGEAYSGDEQEVSYDLSPIPSPSPYNDHSAPSSADYLHLHPPASNGSGFLPAGSNVSVNTEWGSQVESAAFSSSFAVEPPKRRAPRRRGWTTGSWDLGRREDAGGLMTEDVWDKSLSRSFSYDHAGEYRHSTVLTREHLKMDLALYDALLDLRLRQTHLTRMRGRFEALASLTSLPRNALFTHLTSLTTHLTTLLTSLSSLPNTESHRTLNAPAGGEHSLSGIRNAGKLERGVLPVKNALESGTADWEEVVEKKLGMRFDDAGEEIVSQSTKGGRCEGGGAKGWGTWVGGLGRRVWGRA